MPDIQSSASSPIEGIDFPKLLILLRRYFFVLLILFVVPIIGGYLYLRYTKNVYESESELKLEIKKQTELALLPTVENQPGSELSGEIEQIRSKVFLAKVADSLPLKISYYYVGKVLNNELYKQNPFEVVVRQSAKTLLDVNWMVEFSGNGGRVFLSKDQSIPFEFDKPINLAGGLVRFQKTSHFQNENDATYFFIIHSEQQLLNYLRGNLQVEPINLEASTIKVAFRDYNALKAYDIVNTIDSLYLSFSNEQKSLATKQKINWLNNELGQIELKMEDYENYFEQFMLANKSSSTSEEIRKIISSLYKTDSQRYQVQKRIRDLEVLQKSISSNEASRIQNISPDWPATLVESIKEKQKLTQQELSLSLSHNPNTFVYKQVDQSLQVVSAEIETQIDDLRNALQSSLQELNKRKQTLENQFATLPTKNTEFTKNQRFYKLYEEFYLSMMQSRAGIEITQAGSLPNFAILSAATLPMTPVSPKRLLIYGVGFTAGFVLCFFFMGIAYLAHNKITGQHEIEKATDIPVLGVIPHSKKKSVDGLHVIHRPKSRISEALRILRTNLDFFIEGKNKNVICVTSTVGGEGKSFVAANLAALFALAQKKAVLVDLDLRKAKTPAFPSGNAEIGMSTVLIKRYALEDAIVKTSYPNLSFIPSGPIPPNPAELLINGEFNALIESLKAKFDFIILDTPPSGLVTDAIMIMKKADISIYLVRANYSKKEFLQHINRLKQLHQFPKLSIVLNALPVNTKGYGYGYYDEQG
jgi:tyrosine-protein kinase Etk/Wzc